MLLRNDVTDIPVPSAPCITQHSPDRLNTEPKAHNRRVGLLGDMIWAYSYKHENYLTLGRIVAPLG